jgi:nitroreductase
MCALRAPRGDVMNTLDAIAQRRSIRQFSSRTIGSDEIEPLLAAAVLAPNHRLTQPWHFYVLGPEARRAYGEVLGSRKAKKIEDPAAARAVIDKVAAAEAAIPAMIAVTVMRSENPETAEEDYAATMMAVQNIALAAVTLGLGTHIRSGAVMNDPRTLALLGVSETERVVALIHLGEPSETPEAKPRNPATSVTAWLK